MTTCETTATTTAEEAPPFRKGRYRLDYEGAEIWMLASSEAERNHRIRACAKEPWTVRWIESFRPGEVFYDVGASTGPYSLVAASRGIQTFAFEPGLPSYARLVDHVGTNNLSTWLMPLPVALSSRTGLGLMSYATTLPGGSGHMYWALDGRTELFYGEPVLQQFVISFRMDDLPGFDRALVPPSHIKLDVDGAEGLVLEGARASLAGPRFRSLMLELDHREEADLLALTHRLGLEMVERYSVSGSGWGLPAGRERSDVAYGLFRRRS